MTTESVTSALYGKGALLALKIGRWSGTKKIRTDDLQRGEVDDTAVNIQQKLLGRDADRDIAHCESEIRKFLNSRSLPFLGMDGVRFVKFGVLDTILKELPIQKGKFDALADALVADYPGLRAAQLKVHNDISGKIVIEEIKKTEGYTPEAREEAKKELQAWLERREDENEKMYPTAEYLRTRFYMNWRVFQITPHDSLGDTGSLDNDLKQWIVEAASENHQLIGIIAKNVLSVLTKTKKLTPRNLRPLYEGCKSFLAGDFSDGGLTGPRGAVLWILTELEAGTGKLNDTYFVEKIVPDEVRLGKFAAKVMLLSELSDETSASLNAKAGLKLVPGFTRLLDWDIK